MIKKLGPVMAALAAATMLFAGTASAATSSPAAHTFGSCHSKGRAAHCVAEGTANHPATIWLHVSAKPHQKVAVGWAVICTKGSGKKHKSGGLIGKAAPTFSHKMTLPYKHPTACVAAADAQLTGKGSIHVWVTVGK